VALIDQLREQRAAVRTAGDGILTRAAEESRDLTPEELADHGARTVEARELDDRIEALLADQVAELRAAQVRQPATPVPSAPILTREQSVHDWLQARGAFAGYQLDQPLSFDRYLRGRPPPAGTAQNTSGPWPRPRSALGAPWCRARWHPGWSIWPATRPGCSRPAP
jgi:hypothetical protein